MGGVVQCHEEEKEEATGDRAAGKRKIWGSEKIYIQMEGGVLGFDTQLLWIAFPLLTCGQGHVKYLGSSALLL